MASAATSPVLTTPSDLRAACDAARARGERVGFVPTMGALHAGHLALLETARQRGATFLVASVFVNPTQFGPNEDFARYPRDLAGDRAKLVGAGAHAIFAPPPAAMYLEGEATRVRVARLTDRLCGPFRPGHFEGVTTVVAKLFSLVGPCVAVFGRKDYQQLRVIQRMAADLFFAVEIVGHPIVREHDGLALSSRNAYLSAEERGRALALSRGLRRAEALFAAGERDVQVLVAAARREVEAVTDRIDYVELLDADTLAPPDGGKTADRALLAIACHIGTTRLIDNRVLGEDQGW